MPKGRKPISKKDAATANAYYTYAAAKGGKDLKKRVDTGPDKSKKVAVPGSPMPEKAKPAPAKAAPAKSAPLGEGGRGLINTLKHRTAIEENKMERKEKRK